MIVLRDPLSSLKAKPFWSNVLNPESYDHPNEHGFFILVEPGDTSEQIELATGYSLLKKTVL